MNNGRLIDVAGVAGVYPPGIPNTATTQYLNLSNYDKIAFVVTGTNNASGITGTTISAVQATALAGTNSKAVNFTRYYSALGNQTSAPAGALTENTLTTTNGFTATTTANANFVYLVEIDCKDVDLSSSFTYVGLTLAAAVNQTVEVTGVLRQPSISVVPPIAANA